MIEQRDLFETPNLWPSDLKALLVSYITKEQSYSNLIQLEIDLKKLGYLIEYGLDCVAFNLQKIQP
jgi:hypothetical protein